MQNRKVLRAVVGLLAIGLAFSACGRRGALESPPSSRVISADETGNKTEKSPTKPDRPFILDGLL